jgi:hypothetical protein
MNEQPVIGPRDRELDPASWENTGNFARLGLRERLLASNAATDSTVYRIIPYALEQGIYSGLAGN